MSVSVFCANDNNLNDPLRSLSAADRLIFNKNRRMTMTRSWAGFVVAVVTVGCTSSNARAQPATDDTGFASMYRSGQSAMAAGRFDEALVAFERLEKMDPSFAEVHATLGVLDYKLGKFDRAIEEIRTARKLKPGLRGLDALLALSLAETGRHSEALPGLQRGFQQTADTEVRRMCGMQLLRVYTALHRDSDAIEVAVALNRSYPDDPEVLYHTGRIYGNQAYVVMERLHDKAPGSIWMLQAQGEANESQKNFEAAIVAFNHVLALEPHRAGIHYRLGRIYLARFIDMENSKDRDAAIREFNAEFEVDPGSGNAAYELANIAAKSGDRQKATEGFQRALQLFPDFEESLVGLGAVLLDSERPGDAVAPLDRATKIRPDNEVAWYRLAQAERAVGNKEEQQKALTAFRKLHNTTPAGMRRPSEPQDLTPQQLGELKEP